MILDAVKLGFFKFYNTVADAEVLDLDPVCAVFALAMANRYDIGAKPAFTNKDISYTKVLDPLAQAAERERINVGRDDLYRLEAPIVLAIKLWGQNNDFVYMMNEALKGVDRISATYSHDPDNYTIAPTLHRYKDFFERAIATQTQAPVESLNPQEQAIKRLWTESFLTAVRGTYDQTNQLEAYRVQLNTQQKNYITLVRSTSAAAMRQ